MRVNRRRREESGRRSNVEGSGTRGQKTAPTMRCVRRATQGKTLEGDMHMRKESFARLAGAMLFLMLMHSSADTLWAAEKKYPSRPVEIVCGYPPGGAMDLTARIWGKYLEKRLGV